jgi:hypothetical protein
LSTSTNRAAIAGLQVSVPTAARSTIAVALSKSTSDAPVGGGEEQKRLRHSGKLRPERARIDAPPSRR